MGDIEVTQDPEVEDMENGKGLLRLTIKISKNCAECGTEISNKEVEVETEIDLSGFEESN